MSEQPKYQIGDVLLVNHGYGAKDICFKVITVRANHGGAGNHRYWGEDGSGRAWGAYEDQVLVGSDAATAGGDTAPLDEYQTKARTTSPILQRLAIPGTRPPEPRLDEHEIPWCDEHCPHHDGKRCELIGHRPDAICEPAVHILVGLMKRLDAIEEKSGS